MMVCTLVNADASTDGVGGALIRLKMLIPAGP